MIWEIIQDGDVVLKRRPNAENIGKLQPKWGPYFVKAAERPKSFYLTDGKGRTTTPT